MPQVPNWAAYAGFWVALVKGSIAGVGRTEKEAYLAAKASRRREEPELVYVAADGTPCGRAEPPHLRPSPLQASMPRLAEPGGGAGYWALPPLLRDLSEFLQASGAAGWLVGGSVRDLWLQREIHDLDVTTAGDALALGRAVADHFGGAYYPLDEERQVSRVILASDAGGMCLDFSVLRGGAIHEDLHARDFTVNAMALPLDDLRPEAILDPTGGLSDLETGVLRMVSSQSFSDDPARLLRAVRFVEELSLRLDAATESAIQSHAALLGRVSAERVRDELNKMLALPRFGRCARELDRLGLLALVLPEVEPLRGLSQPPPHLWDGLEHTLRTVEAAESLAAAFMTGTGVEPWSGIMAAMAPHRDAIAEYLTHSVAPDEPRLALLKLAALLHDAGKPATRAEERGRIRFFDHPQEGARMAGEALMRLRYSAAAVRTVATLVREHMRLLSLVRVGEASNRALYRFHQALGDASPMAGLLFLADVAATRPLDSEPRRSVIEAVVNRVLHACLAEPHIVAPASLVDGRDLMATLDLEEGPVIGHLLDSIREEQAAGVVSTREEAIAHASRALKRWRRMRNESR